MWAELFSILIIAVFCSQVHCGDDVQSSHHCPPFFVRTNSGCSCGFAIDEETAHYFWVTHVVRCHFTENTTYAYMNPAYCMSYNETTGVTVGYCPYNSCSRREDSQCIGRGLSYVKVEQDPLLINDRMCGDINRTGFLCSKCKDDLGPAVFYYGLPCVKCLGNTRGWLLYLTLAFIPSTIFFLLLTALQIHLSSSALDSMVLVCQISVSIINWNPAAYFSGVKPLRSFQILLITISGIWNLDFFRYVIPPFCINKHMSALHIVSLEYLVALYPLLLITVTYILIELHDRGCRVLISMWRPFHKCFTRFRRQWNPKATIIHAFSCFFLLSCVKMMAISTTILRNTHLYNATLKTTQNFSVFVDPSLKLFHIRHAPYAALGLVSFLIFTLLPLVLLILYPLRLTQRFLNVFGTKAHFLREVIQSLQGCYKDGTGQAGRRDMRIFSSFFFILRIVYISVFVIPLTTAFYVSVIFTFVLIPLVSYFKPYKEGWCNLWSSFVLLAIGTFVIAATLSHIRTAYIVMNILGCLPLLYMIVLVLVMVAKKTHMVNKLKCIYQRATGTAAATSEESLPYRLMNINGPEWLKLEDL